ncbi:hypothetical protein R1flu_020341 [Riccia fluitans]|uniref:Uncharacterized protein n=1 Tax=Riccia fluitans TaxID=41844 RepID=A0ABD1ZLA8_9MARC
MGYRRLGYGFRVQDSSVEDGEAKEAQKTRDEKSAPAEGKATTLCLQWSRLSVGRCRQSEERSRGELSASGERGNVSAGKIRSARGSVTVSSRRSRFNSSVRSQAPLPQAFHCSQSGAYFVPPYAYVSKAARVPPVGRWT